MNAPLHKGHDVAAREVLVQGGAAMLPAYLYSALPTAARHHTLLVFFHGGGFAADRLHQADALLRALVSGNPGTLILAPRYTLAAAGAFPAAIEDAHAVLLWAKAERAAIGWNGKRLLVGGVEAGANLATVANLMAHDRRGPAIAGQILITPMLDASLSSTSMRVGMPHHCETAYRCYLPQAADRMHPYASPLQSSRLRHLAPALIVSVEGDPLRDEAEQYAARLEASGVATVTRRLSRMTSGDDGADAALPDVLEAANAFLARF